jgi:hypothetical protein
MIWHRCDLKLPSLFGPACCGREAATYDRARKAWLCPEHTKERLCEFCQSERAWARLCHPWTMSSARSGSVRIVRGSRGDGETHQINLSLSPVHYPSRVRGNMAPSF